MLRSLKQKMDKAIKLYEIGLNYSNDEFHIIGRELTQKEQSKTPYRYDVINFLIESFNRADVSYLEIGVRNPNHNFSKIKANTKYSVDPGFEFKENPVDFKLTSDDFFKKLDEGTLSLDPNIKFDIIFIDGLHLADQVDRDIENALAFISDTGFVLLHDCNPPTESHARESFHYRGSPAEGYWNGTTWKAFYKIRFDSRITSCCIDTDWGIGVLTKQSIFNRLQKNINPFFEFDILNRSRNESLNLMSYEKFQSCINSSTS